MIKVNITIYTNKWLEATWYEEENEVKTQVHCESYSGHPEHIAMLRAKASEYGTDLIDYESLITEAEDAYVAPTQEELDAIALEQTKAEAQTYLNSTDWYIIRFADSGIEVPQEVKDKRAEARLAL